jgi:hypothetical protein
MLGAGQIMCGAAGKVVVLQHDAASCDVEQWIMGHVSSNP